MVNFQFLELCYSPGSLYSKPRADTDGNMAEAEDEPRWLYFDGATMDQKGPLRAEVVKRLLRKGIVQPSQVVWSEHLPDWAPAAEVEPFKSFWAVWSALWHYIPDAGGERRGPVSTKQLVDLFADGEVDGLTMVWRQEMPEWQPIGALACCQGPYPRYNIVEFLTVYGGAMAWECSGGAGAEGVPAGGQQRDGPRGAARRQHAARGGGRPSLQGGVRVVQSGDWSAIRCAYAVCSTGSNVEAFVAEDGKKYLFDSEANKWVTPEEKIEEDLEALREAAGELAPSAAGTDSSSAKDVVSNAGRKRAADGDPAAEHAAQHAADGPEPSASVAADADAQQKTQKKKKKKKKSDKWKARKTNTWVYVNGLPLDVTVQEVHDHFSKCGVIQQDVTTGEPRIKLYRSKQFDGLNVSVPAHQHICRVTLTCNFG